MVTATIGQTISIPCKINRASLGDAEYVFVMIENSIYSPKKIAWVPRKDITVQNQPLSGIELNAELAVSVIDEKESSFIVVISNEGIQESLEVEKQVLD